MLKLCLISRDSEQIHTRFETGFLILPALDRKNVSSTHTSALVVLAVAALPALARVLRKIHRIIIT
jgi:hypothetical protein